MTAKEIITMLTEPADAQGFFLNIVVSVAAFMTGILIASVAFTWNAMGAFSGDGTPNGTSLICYGLASVGLGAILYVMLHLKQKTPPVVHLFLLVAATLLTIGNVASTCHLILTGASG